MDSILRLLQFEFFQRAVLGGLAIAIMAPLLGQYLVARRVSNFADGVAHIAVFGIVVGLLLENNPTVVGLVVAVLGATIMEWLRERRVVQTDATVTVLLVVSLALVSVLTSRLGVARSLESLLFGSILTITWTEVVTAWGLVLVSVGIVSARYRQLLTVVYQDSLARLVKVSPRGYNYLIMILSALVVGVAIDLIGGLLVSGLMIIPVLTAQLLRRGFAESHLLAVEISVGTMLAGLVVSGSLDLPAGAAIALVGVGVFGVVGVGSWLLK